jgi:hypothetical protein
VSAPTRASRPRSRSHSFPNGTCRFWDRLVTARDTLAGLILINVIHLGIATRQNSQNTVTDKCAVRVLPPSPPAFAFAFAFALAFAFTSSSPHTRGLPCPR